MKHLYSLVFAFLALTNAHLSTAQMVNPTNANTPVSCDGTAFFILHDSYGPPVWSWHWEDDDSTLIAGADSMLMNLCAGNYSLVLDSLGIPVLYESFTIGDPCSNFTGTTTAVNCSAGNCDGAFSFYPTNGAAPYVWNWSTSGMSTSGILTNLCPGTYSVICTDINGCEATATVTITENPPAPLVPNVTHTNGNAFSCSGTASAAPTGGLGAYSYLWSTGATSSSISGLCVGNYSVLVTDSNGDSATVNFTITNPCANFSSNVSVTNCTPGSCDGVINFIPLNGFGPFTYTCSGSSVGPVFGLNNLCADLYTVTCSDANGCVTSATALVTDSSTIHPGLGTTYTPGGCAGTATLNPTGGSGSYYYLWSTGETTSAIDSLCAGNYWITITDSINSADTITVHFTISDVCVNFQLHSNSVVNTNATNCNGMAFASATGGFGALHYTWSTGATTANTFNLCAGTYFVTSTDYLGCSLTDTVIVADSLYILPNLTTTNDLNGHCVGTASLAPTGGTAPYSFQWSNGDTGSMADSLCAGSYSVLVTDADGDSATVSFTITNPCASLFVYYSTTQTIPGNCVGIISAVPNMNPYTYSWSNGGNSTALYNLCPGIYTVTFTIANGCSITQSFTIADSLPASPLDATLALTDDLAGTCSGSATALPTGGFAPYSFHWSTGETTSSITGLCPGVYSVEIWDPTHMDTLHLSFIINDSSTIYGGNPYPNATIDDSLYLDLVSNCVIDYNTIDSASLYQAVYDPINQNLLVTWAVYSPTDTVYISDTLSWSGGPGYYALTISVYCPNKSGNDFFKIETVIYFDGTTVWFSTLGVNEQLLDPIAIFPNPFTNSISVDNKDGAVRSIKLSDLNGRMLSEMNAVNSGMIKLDQLEILSSGTYLLILSGEHSSKTVKVIK